MPDVGFLYSGSQNSLGRQFQEFNRHLPRGITVIPRHADNDYDKLVELAKELIDPHGPYVRVAAKTATTAHPPPKPVVFTSVTDPIGSSLVERGGNLTGVAGMTTELDAARLRLLQELMQEQNPALTRVGVLTNPNRLNVDHQWMKLQQSADPNLILRRRDAGVPGRMPGTSQDITDAIRYLINVERVQALLVTADPLFNDKRRHVIREASIPAIYQWREFVEDNGLMSYGPNLAEEYSIAAKYVGLILGNPPKQPAEIPLYQPTTFELVINRNTAAALNLAVPQTLLDRAEVI
jgi:putative ABC transport system substrate-binding protein